MRLELIKQFIRWIGKLFVRTPRVDPILKLVEAVIENQRQQQIMSERTTQAMLEAVGKIGEANSKQAEVLNSYLKLFQTPNEPQRWTSEDDKSVMEDMAKQGFPLGASESDQAEWVLKHMDLI